MNVLYVNIIDYYMNVDDLRGIYEQGRKARFSDEIATRLHIEKVEEKLTHLIMTEKGDGIDLEINSCGNNVHYIDIILLLNGIGDPEYNIDYIIVFWKKISSNELEAGLIDSYPEFNTYIYVQSEDDVGELMKELELNGVQSDIITESRNRFERGAGDFWNGFLLGIASNAGYATMIYVLKKVVHKAIKSYQFRSIELTEVNLIALKRKVSMITDCNINDIHLISFESNNQETEVKVVFKNKYRSYIVVVDHLGHIIELKIDQRLVTNI